MHDVSWQTECIANQNDHHLLIIRYRPYRQPWLEGGHSTRYDADASSIAAEIEVVF